MHHNALKTKINTPYFEFAKIEYNSIQKKYYLLILVNCLSK